MRRAPGLVACLLALTLVLTGCSSGSKDDEAGPAPADPSSSGSLSIRTGLDGSDGTALSVTDEDLVALFAGAGIATYADAADAEPEVPVTEPGAVEVTGWQLQNIRRQLNSGRGYLGRDLDSLTADTGAGPQPVPISVVLAAWLQAADSPASDAGRELMGERDWANDALDLTYPDAVLMLFTADLTRDGAPDAASASPAAYLQPPAPGVCSAVSGFVQDTFSNVVNILKFEADGGVTGVLATIWNTIIDIAASAAQIALGAVTSTLMAPIKQVAGVISLLSAASSLLVPWQVKPEVTPAELLQPGLEGEVTATIDPGPVQWPADLTDCAQVLLGIGLPQLGDASGSAATWTVDDPDQTVSYGSTSTTVDSAQQTRLAFATLPEDPALATGQETKHYVGFGVKVERAQVDQLVDLIDGLLVSGLPQPILTIVQTLLGPLESETRAQLKQLASVEGPVSSILTIRHLPPEPTPPGGEPTPDACAVGPAGTLPDGKWSGPILMQVVGTGAGTPGQVTSTGKGQLKATVKDGKVHGTWKVTWRSAGTLVQDGVKVRLDINGTVSGTASGSAKQPDLEDNWSIKGVVNVTVSGMTTGTPISHSGHGQEYLKVVDASCAGVSATFVPSFNTKGNPVGVTFKGSATWTGTKIG